MGQSAGLLVTSALRRSALLRHGLDWTGRRTLSGNTGMEAEEDQASTENLATNVSLPYKYTYRFVVFD